MTRGRVYKLQCNHSMVRVAQNPQPNFTVSSETPPSWRVRFPYLHTPGTGWHSIPAGTGFPLRRLLRLVGLRWRYSNPPPTWRARSPYLHPRALGSLYVVSYHSQAYGENIITPPSTCRARFSYLYPPGTWWYSYTPRHWVPFTSSLTTRRATVEVF
jgi:hypothetical protein